MRAFLQPISARIYFGKTASHRKRARFVQSRGASPQAYWMSVKAAQRRGCAKRAFCGVCVLMPGGLSARLLFAGRGAARGRGKTPPPREETDSRASDTGRAEASAPTRQNRNRAKRDVEDAVPYTLCHCEERSDAAIRPSQPKETDSHASVYPKGTCFAARTGVGMTARRAGNGGTHGSRPTGCGGHPGRTEASAPTTRRRGRRPLRNHKGYVQWADRGVRPYNGAAGTAKFRNFFFPLSASAGLRRLYSDDTGRPPVL